MTMTFIDGPDYELQEEIHIEAGNSIPCRSLVKKKIYTVAYANKPAADMTIRMMHFDPNNISPVASTMYEVLPLLISQRALPALKHGGFRVRFHTLTSTHKKQGRGVFQLFGFYEEESLYPAGLSMHFVLRSMTKGKRDGKQARREKERRERQRYRALKARESPMATKKAVSPPLVEPDVHWHRRPISKQSLQEQIKTLHALVRQQNSTIAKLSLRLRTLEDEGCVACQDKGPVCVSE